MGTAGDDTLVSGPGVDVMVGGLGNDTYNVNNTGDTTVDNGGEGTDTVFASVDYTLVNGTEIEFLYANAGATGLRLTGSDSANTIVGSTGNDTLAGGSGGDILTGGGGANVFSLWRYQIRLWLIVDVTGLPISPRLMATRSTCIFWMRTRA